MEKAWPRLIAASYLVVTGLIKDDEPSSLSLSLSVGLALSLSLTHSLLLAEKQIDSLQSPITSCFWKGEENGKMMAKGRGGGGSKEGGKQGRTELFISAVFPLKRTAREQKLAECSRAAEVHRLQQHAPFSTSSHRVERPQRLDE